MSGPLCGMPDGTTLSAQLAANSAAPAGERKNKTPIYVSELTDTRGFLSLYGPRVTAGFHARLRGRGWCLSHEPLTASDPQKAHCDPSMEATVWVFTPLSRRIVVFVCWLRTWTDKCLRTSSGRWWRVWTFVSRESCSCGQGAVTRKLPNPAP